MKKQEAEKLIQSLRKQIEKHNELYHTQDRPEISDFEFDKLFQELLDLEEKYPEFKSENSPTQKVGGHVLDFFEKAEHEMPMHSLQNTYSAEEIIEFEKKIQRQLNSDQPIEFYCSPKYDGVAIELIYKNGKLTEAITRGDGKVGENVFNNIKTIADVPHNLKGKNIPPRMDIRGEVLIYKSEFLRINQFQEDQGQNTFANPRNAAAGTIRQLDSRVVRSRNLKMFCYSLGFSEQFDPPSQESFEKVILDFGLPVMPLSKGPQLEKNKLSFLCHGASEVIEYYKSIEELRQDLDFEIDGIVVKVNSFSIQKSLGYIARSPRWAFAAKFTPQQAETKVTNIQIQVGRTGALTPVAIMEPVSVGGVTITNATLHNQDEIDRKDIRIGDVVKVHRAGDVIPEIIEVVKKHRAPKSKPFKIPEHCPVCGEKAEQLQDEVVKRCINSLCPAVMKEALKHFVSRNAMNIDKLGSRLIEVFYENSLILKFSDIYKLQFDDVIKLERQGEKSVSNLLKSIEESKNTELHRFIYALGIRFVGEQTARTLAQAYKSPQNFLSATYDQLIELPDIGPKVADSVAKVLQHDNFKNEIHNLLKLGVHPKEIKDLSSTQSSQLKDVSFVVTGTLPIPRNEVKDLIRAAGGTVSSSVSKKTSVLVAGENAGSKLEKAEKLEVEVWSWEDLQNKLNGSKNS